MEGGSKKSCALRHVSVVFAKLESPTWPVNDCNTELHEDPGEKEHCAPDGISTPTKGSSSEAELNIQTQKITTGHSWQGNHRERDRVRSTTCHQCGSRYFSSGVSLAVVHRVT